MLPFLQKKSIQDKLKSQKEEEENIQREIDDYDKEIKLFATKKNTLMTRIEECNENIGKLGPLPLQEQTKYQNMGTKQVSILYNFKIKVISTPSAHPQWLYTLFMQSGLRYIAFVDRPPLNTDFFPSLYASTVTTAK